MNVTFSVNGSLLAKLNVCFFSHAVRLFFLFAPPLLLRRASVTDDDTPFDPANEPYVKGVKRGQICAFMTGFSFFIMETKVAVESVIHFMPGMRIAIATQAEEVSVFERCRQLFFRDRGNDPHTRQHRLNILQ